MKNYSEKEDEVKKQLVKKRKADEEAMSISEQGSKTKMLKTNEEDDEECKIVDLQK